MDDDVSVVVDCMPELQVKKAIARCMGCGSTTLWAGVSLPYVGDSKEAETGLKSTTAMHPTRNPALTTPIELVNSQLQLTEF